jgi:hypothetical protein
VIAGQLAGRGLSLLSGDREGGTVRRAPGGGEVDDRAAAPVQLDRHLAGCVPAVGDGPPAQQPHHIALDVADRLVGDQPPVRAEARHVGCGEVRSGGPPLGGGQGHLSLGRRGAHRVQHGAVLPLAVLHALFLFENVGVTAYKGAAPLINNKTYLEAAAGNIRSALYEHESGLLGTGLLGGRDLKEASVKLSNARDSLDGSTDLDQGVIDNRRHANIVPTDGNGIAFSRSTGQVLNVVYLTNKQATSGGFFPRGVNGEINASADNA